MGARMQLEADFGRDHVDGAGMSTRSRNSRVLSSARESRMRRVIGTTSLVAAVISGAIMMFLSPPFQAPDEVNQFYRAWTLAEGRVFASRESNLIGAPVWVAIWRWVKRARRRPPLSSREEAEPVRTRVAARCREFDHHIR